MCCTNVWAILCCPPFRGYVSSCQSVRQLCMLMWRCHVCCLFTPLPLYVHSLPAYTKTLTFSATLNLNRRRRAAGPLTVDRPSMLPPPVCANLHLL